MKLWRVRYQGEYWWATSETVAAAETAETDAVHLLGQSLTALVNTESDTGPNIPSIEGGQSAAGVTNVSWNMLDIVALCEPQSIVCVGKNYAKHIAEMQQDATQKPLPTEPGLFLKAPNALSAPDAPIVYPNWTDNFHYEGELAVVIGKTLRNVAEQDALAHVLGYTCALDMTARDKQYNDLQWIRGKSADGFCPLGNWLKTDLDPNNVSVKTWLNGTLKQDGHTSDMIFSVAHVLSYVSHFMTLVPGDVVLTGTPEGVGPVAAGDTLKVAIGTHDDPECLTLTRDVVAERSSATGAP